MNAEAGDGLAKTIMFYRLVILGLDKIFTQWEEERNVTDSEEKRVRALHRDHIARYYRRADEFEIEAAFPEKGNREPRMPLSFVHLPPAKKEQWLFPVLSITLGLQKTPVEVRLKVGLFKITPGGVYPTAALGARFESPEGYGEGMHNYWHAQFFRYFNKSNDNPPKLPHCPEWIPESQPAFPIDANGPRALLAAMLASIYGPEYVRNKIFAEVENAKNLPKFQGVECVRAPSEPIFTLKDSQEIKSFEKVSVRIAKHLLADEISTVQLFLQRQADEKYWNGSAWTDHVSHVELRNTSGIIYGSGVLPDASRSRSGHYEIRVVATDTNGRWTVGSRRVNIE